VLETLNGILYHVRHSGKNLGHTFGSDISVFQYGEASMNVKYSHTQLSDHMYTAYMYVYITGGRDMTESAGCGFNELRRVFGICPYLL
jgi:hypothetical protein